MGERQELKVPGRIIEYVPPLTNGDNDWDEGFDCRVIGESEIFNDTIRARVYMLGNEREPDWTQVEGVSDWLLVYSAPPGCKIKSATPIGPVTREYSFRENENRKVFSDTAEGAVVSKFEIHGFKNDNPRTAGWHTRVIAYFNAVNVVIEH